MNWVNDKRWADRYRSLVEKCLRPLAGVIVEFRLEPTDDDTDQQQAADYLVVTKAGTIACRIRKPGCCYRDLTLRSERASGASTELSKIQDGWARWYFYAWVSDDETGFSDWILVDLNALRSCGLLDRDWRQTWNHDGHSAFISIGVQHLLGYGCIVGGTPVKQRIIAVG